MVGVAKRPKAADCGSAIREFESHHPPHRQTQQIYFLLKTLILGLRNVTVNSVLFIKNYSLEGNAMGNEILNLENRISQLRGRTGRENGKIIKKLQRRLRKLTNNA